ncbi:putative U box domain, armadillo repeat-containing domain, armadillo-like helical [Dioscorea sansibarensis]
MFVFSSRASVPLAGAFFTPAGLSGTALIQTIAGLSRDLSVSSPLQRRNSRFLLRCLKILSTFFESLLDSELSPSSSSSADLCFKELYVLVHRAKALLHCCSHSGRLWLLIQSHRVSGYFHDLSREIYTLLDILPIGDFKNVAGEAREQVELLRRQLRESKPYLDPHEESLRRLVFSFLDGFEDGCFPDQGKLREAFIQRLGIRSASACRAEVDFLEERIHVVDDREYDDADPAVLSAMAALARYSRFALFGFQEDEVDRNGRTLKKGVVSREVAEQSISIPKDFCCPISLDLMRDPVIISSGQTYDRESITRWLEDGHCTCPNSGQTLNHTRLVPNRALRSLISQWCAANSIAYDSPDTGSGIAAAAASNKAAAGATRATVDLLVRLLSNGSDEAKTVAVRELRFLAKTGKDNRACIANAGAIPFLHLLLSSSNAIAQENTVTAILNLSILDKNKNLIMSEHGCLGSIVSVLRSGWTTEARENAAATLFSLSAIHDYKKMIMAEPGAVEALAELLTIGSSRGKKDAVTALFNLSTHPESGEKMVSSGAVSALVSALGMEGVAEEAAGALAMLMRQAIVASEVGKEDKAVAGLVRLMRSGSPRAKENAVAALNEMCRSGGAAMTKRVASTPALGALIQTLLFTGTKRARRKAASLARMCQRCETVPATMALGGGWGIEYVLGRSSTMARGGGAGADVPVSGLVAISVPVL